MHFILDGELSILEWRFSCYNKCKNQTHQSVEELQIEEEKQVLNVGYIQTVNSPNIGEYF